MKTCATSLLLSALCSTAFLHAADPNTLSPEEKQAGWRLLFDGKSTSGWQALGGKPFPETGWSVRDGSIVLAKGSKVPDIVTAEQFLNFEFSWDWKIAHAGNSGVKYNLPDPAKNLGFEYQMLDDANHPDGVKNGTLHQTASLYDLLQPAPERKVKPVGEWNSSRIVVNGSHAEHWLNGTRTVSFEIGSPEMQKAVAGSKYRSVPKFGEKIASPLLLQNHGDAVEFRNLKIRPISNP
ncbi:MAG: hypothetical protein RLZZ253_3215 [Verrucomicrobiota bacterium]|jgi:hypothetical protein